MRFVLTVFGGRLLNARAKTVSTLATTISPSCRQTTDAIRDRLPDPAPQPERTRPSVRLPLVQPVADLAVQDRAGRRCRPARSCGHRSDAATRRGGHTNPGGVRPAGIASIEVFPSTVGWGQMRAEVGVNHGINAQAANGSSARGSQRAYPKRLGRPSSRSVDHRAVVVALWCWRFEDPRGDPLDDRGGRADCLQAGLASVAR